MVVGLDFETVPFEPGLMAPPPVCLALADESGESLVHWTAAEEILEKQLSADRPVSIVNAGFDMAVTCAWYPRLIPLVFDAYDRGIIKDPSIRQKLIDLALGTYLHRGAYSLANIANWLAGASLDKDESPRLDYERYLHEPDLSKWEPEHVEYPKEDARWHRETYLMQQRELEAEDKLEVLEDEDRQARADFALQLTSVWGLRTDAEGVELLRTECLKRVATLEPMLMDAGLAIRTSKGVSRKKAPAQERMLLAMGGEIEATEVDVGKRKPRMKRTVEVTKWGKAKVTKTGRQKRKDRQPWMLLKYVSVDAEACADSADDLLLAYSEYSQLTSLLSGQIKVLERGIYEPLHTRFEVLQETGRTGSSGGNAGNIQNVRRKPGARECFKPRDGTDFAGADFDKAELHTLAQTCIDIFGYSTLGDALNRGYDPHTGLGARLAGISYEELIKAIDEGNEAVAGRVAYGRWSSWRDIAKPGNFGFPGGMGVFGMMAYAKAQYGIKLTLEETEHLYSAWGEQWPDVSQDYLGWIRQLCAPDGWANIKHFTSNRWRTHIPFCVAANSFFQGRAADGAKKALYEVVRRCYSDKRSALYGCRPVNFIHDEIIIEAAHDVASDAAWEMSRVMVEAFNEFTPDVPVRATPVLMNRWSKKAKTLIDANGRLQVWQYQRAA